MTGPYYKGLRRTSGGRVLGPESSPERLSEHNPVRGTLCGVPLADGTDRAGEGQRWARAAYRSGPEPSGDQQPGEAD